MSGRPRTTVHLLRHGEVENPDGVLYGRMPGFHLSRLGLEMAQRVAETVAERDITYVLCSPLERARETAAPAAAALGLDVVVDERVIEAANAFEGQRFGVGDGSLRKPAAWRHLYNPFQPSWGEPYKDIAVRMVAALHDVREAATGSEALVVSHQLPIWIARRYLQGQRLFHDPRRRQCSLASLTTVHYEGAEITSVAYSEPAADLVPARAAKKFTAGA
ncbi:MAG: histidine phosphatase family protein [Nocardioidaceae bacterium]